MHEPTIDSTPYAKLAHALTNNQALLRRKFPAMIQQVNLGIAHPSAATALASALIEHALASHCLGLALFA